MMLSGSGLVQNGSFDVYHVVGSYLFIPTVHPVTHEIEPVLIPGWTLNYEMFFYLLFGALLYLPEAYRLGMMAFALVTIVVLGCFLHSLFFEFYGSSRILEFATGMGLAWALSHGWRMSVPVGLCLIVVGFIALVALPRGHLPIMVTGGLPSLAIVSGCASLECLYRVRDVVAMRLLGDSSYSLYLSHGIVLSAYGQVWRKMGLSVIPLPIFVLLGIGVAVFGGVMLYRYVEKPLLRLYRRPPVARPARTAS
jgi:exopolysaccharide production protein ExoZ